MSLLKASGAAIMAALMVTSVAWADTLRVGTEATYAPFEFTDDQGQVVGFDADIITAIAKEAGFEGVEFRNMPFDGLIPALMTGQIDTAIAAITITDERKKRVDFSEPYYRAGLSVLIREDSKDKYPNIDALKSSRLCAQIGTTGARKAEEISGKVGAFNTEPEAFMELKAGGCEGVVNDRPVNLYYLRTANAAGVVEIPEIISAEQYGIAVRKGNTQLLDKLNSALRNMRDRGDFAKIHTKWFTVAE